MKASTSAWAVLLDNIFAERLRRNVKYKEVYSNGYVAMDELHAGLTRYFTFYNWRAIAPNVELPDTWCV